MLKTNAQMIQELSTTLSAALEIGVDDPVSVTKDALRTIWMLADDYVQQELREEGINSGLSGAEDAAFHAMKAKDAHGTL